MKLREAVAEAEQTLTKLKEMQTRMGPDAVIGMKPGGLSLQETAGTREQWEQDRFAGNLGFSPRQKEGLKILEKGRGAFNPHYNSAVDRPPAA